jgi:hypothetical protein
MLRSTAVPLWLALLATRGAKRANGFKKDEADQRPRTLIGFWGLGEAETGTIFGGTLFRLTLDGMVGSSFVCVPEPLVPTSNRMTIGT